MLLTFAEMVDGANASQSFRFNRSLSPFNQSHSLLRFLVGTNVSLDIFVQTIGTKKSLWPLLRSCLCDSSLRSSYRLLFTDFQLEKKKKKRQIFAIQNNPTSITASWPAFPRYNII